MIAQRVGNTKTCTIRPRHAQKAQKMSKSSRARRALTFAVIPCDTTEEHSAKTPPPRGHPDGGDAPNDLHEPVHRSGAGHHCGGRACRDLAPPHAHPSEHSRARPTPHTVTKQTRRELGQRAPCAVHGGHPLRTSPRAPSGERARRRLAALHAPAMHCGTGTGERQSKGSDSRPPPPIWTRFEIKMGANGRGSDRTS